MKINISKEWIMEKAKLEEGVSIEAGSPPTPREQWLAETRRLLVTKYGIAWPAKDIADYAEALAADCYDDTSWRVTPDEAIDEDFRAGL